MENSYWRKMQFGPDSLIQAFPVGKWRRIGKPAKGGRYTIEAQFKSRGELAFMMALCGSSEPMVLEAAQEFLAQLPLSQPAERAQGQAQGPVSEQGKEEQT